MPKRLLLLSLSFLFLLGCGTKRREVRPAANVEAEQSSPMQLGVAARVTALVAEAQQGTLHGVLGVHRQWFDGGHDNIFTVGIQGRRFLDHESGTGPWLGAEFSYNNWRVSEELAELGNPVSNVFGLHGLYGHPVGGSGLHLWGSAGVLFFGDFKEDGEVAFTGSTGWLVQVGVEFPNLLGGN